MVSPAQRRFLFAQKSGGAKPSKPAAPALMSQLAQKGADVNLSAENSFSGPKWAKSPWDEMLKRKGIKSLTKANKGF